MKLGIISDTHARAIDEIPSAIKKALACVDFIIHAGDFTNQALLDGLGSIGKVRAVCGNMDSIELKRSLPERDIFEFSGKKIGIIHDSGAPWGISERIRKQFSGVDIIVFGHSHKPYSGYVQGVFLVNPGHGKSSFALVTIDDTIKAEILSF